MVAVVMQHIQTTIGLLVFCVLGVAGGVGDVEINPVGLSATIEADWYGVAIPPVAYYNPATWAGDMVRVHEMGHLSQERDVGPLYYLVVGLPSVMIHLTGSRHIPDWPEHDATRRGEAL